MITPEQNELTPIWRDGKTIARTESGLRVYPIRSKSGYIITRTGGLAHSVKFAGAIWVNGLSYHAAALSCGVGTYRPVFIQDAEEISLFCERCVDRDLGPCVYRCFNENWDLLYIGSTGARIQRIASHKKLWGGSEIAHVRFEDCGSIAEARATEYQAIYREAPRYNRRHQALARGAR